MVALQLAAVALAPTAQPSIEFEQRCEVRLTVWVLLMQQVHSSCPAICVASGTSARPRAAQLDGCALVPEAVLTVLLGAPSPKP